MRIFFFTGKGGVGKSTMAAAAAWQLSRKARVLIVSLDPAHNLGDIFETTVKDKKKRFDKNLFLKEVDIRKLSQNYLQKQIRVLSDVYKYLQTLNLDNYFSVLKYSPGIEEYALLMSIEETIRNEEGFDYIIFDTPPTGLTLRFLAMPKITMTWIERLIQIRRKILEKRYTIYRIAGTLSKEETVLNYDEKKDDILNKLRELNGNYNDLNRILQGENCSFVVVFNPDILSLKESGRLIDGLDDLGLPLRLFIDNKVSDENAKTADDIERNMRHIKNLPIKRVTLTSFYDGARKLYDIPDDMASVLTDSGPVFEERTGPGPRLE